MLARPTPVDGEVAAVTFKSHLDELWTSSLAADNGWGRFTLDPIHVIITMWAVRQDGLREHYFVQLGGEYYDQWPPTVCFVEPQQWKPVGSASRWWPQIACPDWFGLHLSHPGISRQLVCFSFTAEYYMVDHTPILPAVWKPGVHTLAATLMRLQEILRFPHYQKPSL